MDINSILKKLDVSKLKVFFLMLFDKEALLDYVYEKANNAINELLNSNAETVQKIREKLAAINGYAIDIYPYCPPPWQPYANDLNRCLQLVYNATADNNLSPEEVTGIINAARQAYSAWMAD